MKKISLLLLFIAITIVSATAQDRVASRLVRCDVPGLEVRVKNAVRTGKSVTIDVIFTNLTDESMNAGVCGEEPCGGYEDYKTIAYDTEGDIYRLDHEMKAYQGNNEIRSDIVLPPGTPVKISYVIGKMPAYVYHIPFFSMAFRGLMPRESYGQALVKVRNLPIQ